MSLEVNKFDGQSFDVCTFQKFANSYLVWFEYVQFLECKDQLLDEQASSYIVPDSKRYLFWTVHSRGDFGNLECNSTNTTLPNETLETDALITLGSTPALTKNISSCQIQFCV